MGRTRGASRDGLTGIDAGFIIGFFADVSHCRNLQLGRTVSLPRRSVDLPCCVGADHKDIPTGRYAATRKSRITNSVRSRGT